MVGGVAHYSSKNPWKIISLLTQESNANLTEQLKIPVNLIQVNLHRNWILHFLEYKVDKASLTKPSKNSHGLAKDERALLLIL
jgi:hypothetical protein